MLAMHNVVECWAVKKLHVQKISVAKKENVRWINGNTRKDGI